MLYILIADTAASGAVSGKGGLMQLILLIALIILVAALIALTILIQRGQAKTNWDIRKQLDNKFFELKEKIEVMERTRYARANPGLNSRKDTLPDRELDDTVNSKIEEFAFEFRNEMKEFIREEIEKQLAKNVKMPEVYNAYSGKQDLPPSPGFTDDEAELRNLYNNYLELTDEQKNKYSEKFKFQQIAVNTYMSGAMTSAELMDSNERNAHFIRTVPKNGICYVIPVPTRSKLMQDLELEKYRPLFNISGALAGGKRKVTLHKPALIVPAGSNRYSLKEKGALEAI
jgi:hypothetical protein